MNENNDGRITTDEIAEPLGVSAQRLHLFLQDMGVIKRRRYKWFLRTPYRGKGLEVRYNNRYLGKEGQHKYNSHLYWTRHGRNFIHQLWYQEQSRVIVKEKLIQPELPLWGIPVTT